MGQTGVRKKVAAALCALLAAAVCAFSALPARAGEAEVSAVLELLGSLQSADINPAWPPDIEANEASVQNLLDLYGACSAEDRARFTAGQNADLKAYFAALYEVQGRDAAEADALFEPDSSATAGPQQPSSSGSVSEAPPPASEPSSQPSSSSAPSPSVSRDESSSAAPRPGTVVSAPGESSPPASLPDIQNPPETPGDGGWSGFFGGGAVGPILLVTLAGLAAVVFVRFLVLLRRAGRPSDEEQGEALRDEELFGEAYDPSVRGGAQSGDSGEAAPRPKRRGTTTTGQSEQPRHTSGVSGPQAPPSDGKEPPPELWPEINAADDTQGAAAVREAAGQETAGPSHPAPAGGTQAEALPSAGIALRGFSPQARTGRPAKMPFRQGRPDDIDAIDE